MIKVSQRKQKGRLRNYLRSVIRHRTLLLMLLPAFLYFLIFRYGSIAGISIAFIDFKARIGQSYFESILNSEFVGLRYFIEFLTSRIGREVLGNTIIISLYKIVFGFPAPIILALLLNELTGTKYKRVVQTITYMPHFISWVILAGIVRMILSPDFGLLLPVFRAFGMEPINFIGSSNHFRGLLVATDIWREVGWGSIIYLAALTGLDPQLFEAARIDGASRLKQIWHVTLPGIAATVVVMMILRLGTVLDAGFDQIFNMQNAAVLSTSEILDTYIYKKGIIESKFSYTAAIGVFKSTIGIAFVLLTNFAAKRLGQEGIV